MLPLPDPDDRTLTAADVLAPRPVAGAAPLPGELEAHTPPVAGVTGRPSTGPPLQRLGEYEILAEIARGGMGVVYKARHIRLSRIVALKMILSGQLAGNDEVQRFQSEAQMAAGLDHPGIVPVHEFGEIDGRPFFSMGFVEGCSLAQRLREGPLPPREAADVVRQIAVAVQFAHDRGVIHRDLKPGNVLLETPLDDQPTGLTPRPEVSPRLTLGRTVVSAPATYRNVRVTDFGLAKQMHSDSSLTATGQVLGTPSYMPPEQAAGRHDQMGVTTDVYSIGAILYATLTGRPPFQAATLPETLRQVIEREPVAPRTLDSGIPRGLETIALKCLRKSPAERYPTAADLASELRRFLAGEPILARPAGQFERAIRWCGRQPVQAALLAVATLLVGLLAIGGPIVAWREAALRGLANAGTLKANEQSKLARERAEDLQKTSQQLEQRSRDLAQQVVRANAASQTAREQTALREQQLDRSETVLLANRLRQAQQALAQNEVSLAMEQLELCPPERRGWEWHYLARQIQRLRLVYEFQGNAGDVEFLPNGQSLLASARPNGHFFKDDLVKLWNANTAREILSVPGTSACVLDGGKVVAILGYGATAERSVVRLYDAESGLLLREMAGEHAAGIALNVGPEPQTVTAIDAEGMLRVWNTQTGAESYSLRVCDGRPQISYLSHKGLMQSVRFSPDGHYVYLFPENLPGQCYDLREHRVTPLRLGILAGPGFNRNPLPPRELKEKGAIYSATFSPDSRWLLKHRAGDPPLMELCDPATGETKAALVLDHSAWSRSYSRPLFNAIAFSPDGSQLAVGSGFPNSSQADSEVGIFSTATGRETAHFAWNTDSVYQMAFSPDGTRLAVGGSTGRVEVHDAKTGDAMITFRHGTSDGTLGLAFSPDGQSLAVGSRPYRGSLAKRQIAFHLWDLRPPSAPVRVAELSYFLYRPTVDEAHGTDYTGGWLFSQNDPAMWFSPDSRLLSRAQIQVPHTHRKSRSVRLPDMKLTGPESPHAWVSPDGSHRVQVDGRIFNPQTRRFSTGRVRLVDTGSEQEVFSHVEPDWLRAAGFSTDSRSIALLLEPQHFLDLQNYTSPGFHIRLLDVQSGRQRADWSSRTAAIRQATLAGDGARLAVVVDQPGHATDLQIWDAATGTRRSLTDSRGTAITGLRFSPDSTLVTAVFYDNSIRIWEASSGQLRSTFRAPGKISSMDFSADGTRLFASAEDRTVRIWDVKWGQELAMLDCTPHVPTHLAVSPDGRWLAALNQISEAWLWDAMPEADRQVAMFPPAIEELTGQITAGRDDADVYRLRGEARLLRETPAEAAEDFAAAVRRDPGNLQTRQRLSETALRIHRWDLLEFVARRDLDDDDKSGDRWLRLGETQARQRRFAEAAQSAQRGEALIHNNLDHKWTVAALFLAANDQPAYAKAYAAARKQTLDWGWTSDMHPNRVRNLYLLARMSALSRELADSLQSAEDWAQLAVAAEPRGPWCWHALGLVQLRSGQPGAAIKSFRSAIQVDGGWCPGLNELGLALALRATGQASEAAQQARSALHDTRWSDESASDRPLLPQAWHLHDWLGLHLLRREVAALHPIALPATP